MRKLSLKRFTNHVFLKRIGRELLDPFFERFPEVRDQAGALLPAAPNALDYYSALAGFFMRAERLPAALIEELLAIEEMSTPDGLARLQRSLEWPGLQAQLRPDSTADDIAMQIWLAAPEILAREHNALRFRRLTSFEHAGAKAAARSLQGANPPDRLTIANLTVALDAWFASHQRGAETTQVEVYPMDGDLWFLIRHGDLFKRIAKVDRQRTDILHFRPRRDDLVVHSWRLNELRVSARSKAERDL